MLRFLAGAAVTSKSLRRPQFPTATDLAAHFFSTQVADIAPEDYIARLRKYAHCSESVFVHALALLRRLASLDYRLQISPYNVHRLMITAVMISAKFLDHAWFTSSYYAKVGGIATVNEMNAMELAMLKLLDFRVFVQPDELAVDCVDCASVVSTDADAEYM